MQVPDGGVRRTLRALRLGARKARIGQGLRDCYPIAPDLPAALLMLVKKIGSSESPQQVPSTWPGKLDALEGCPVLLEAAKSLRDEDSS
jgi:hypothetical protein